MQYIGYNVETLIQQFHTRSVSYNNFSQITEEDVKRIQKLLEQKRLVRQYVEPKTQWMNQGLNNYFNTLQYLTNPTIGKDLKTFDEKVLFLILSCDPDLTLYKNFLETDIISVEQIETEENMKKQKQLRAERKEQISSYTAKVRNELGFYDSKLLKYESKLAQGILKKEGFASDIKKPVLDKLLQRAQLLKGISTIDEQALQKLNAIKEQWLTEAKDPKDLNSLAYNLLNKYKDLHINTVEEQIILFILIADPELDLLRIFEEESTFDAVKEKSIEELGFYNKGLIKVEQFYHDKFEPEKKLSAWTK